MKFSEECVMCMENNILDKIFPNSQKRVVSQRAFVEKTVQGIDPPRPLDYLIKKNFRGQWSLKLTVFWERKLLATVVEGDLKAPFSIATIPRCREVPYSFP